MRPQGEGTWKIEGVSSGLALRRGAPGSGGASQHGPRHWVGCDDDHV